MLVTGDEIGVHVRCESYGISVDAKILMVWIPAECCEAVECLHVGADDAMWLMDAVDERCCRSRTRDIRGRS